VGRRARSYTRGEVSYLPAGVEHSQSFGPAGARQIIFRPEPEWLEYLTDDPLATNPPHANAPTFCQLGDRLLDEFCHRDELSPLACEGLMLEIVAAFARQGGTQDRRAIPVWLRRAREFIEENSATPFRLKDLARAADRHEVHLAREFRRYFGESVGSFARRQRLERAAQLLVTAQTLSITEIALTCGLSSHSHLCREFRRQYGASPSQYRASMS
jgi:AraC family transcriptional regulator